MPFYDQMSHRSVLNGFTGLNMSEKAVGELLLTLKKYKKVWFIGSRI